jgi:hypothetical protein
MIIILLLIFALRYYMALHVIFSYIKTNCLYIKKFSSLIIESKIY